MCAEIYKLYKQMKATKATLLWYKIYGGDKPNFENDEVDICGSKVKQFF